MFKTIARSKPRHRRTLSRDDRNDIARRVSMAAQTNELKTTTNIDLLFKDSESTQNTVDTILLRQLPFLHDLVSQNRAAELDKVLSKVKKWAPDSLGQLLDMGQRKTQNTALHDAMSAPKCAAESVKVLVRYTATLDMPNAKKETPLHLACSNCRIQSARILLMAGANFAAKDLEGRLPTNRIKDINPELQEDVEKFTICFTLWDRIRPMVGAVEENDAATFAKLVSEFIDDNNPFLHHLIDHGFADVVPYIVAAIRQLCPTKRKLVTCSDTLSQTLLHKITQVPNEIAVPLLHRLILTFGLDPNAQDRDGYTPLIRYIQADRMDLVDAILCHSATDASRAPKYGPTPLFCYVFPDNSEGERGNLENDARLKRILETSNEDIRDHVFRTLVALENFDGAKVIRNSPGASPPRRVARQLIMQIRTKTEMPSKEVLLKLVRSGDVPVLHEAYRLGDREFVSEFLQFSDYQFDEKEISTILDTPDSTDEDQTVLHLTAAAGDVAITRILLGKGASIKQKDKLGRVPINRVDAIANQHRRKQMIEEFARVDIYRRRSTLGRARSAIGSFDGTLSGQFDLNEVDISLEELHRSPSDLKTVVDQFTTKGDQTVKRLLKKGGECVLKVTKLIRLIETTLSKKHARAVIDNQDLVAETLHWLKRYRFASPTQGNQKYLALAQVLLNQLLALDPDLSIVGKTKKPVLVEASVLGLRGAVQLMLKKGADPNQRITEDPKSDTVLMAVLRDIQVLKLSKTEFENIEACVRALIISANTTLTDKTGKTVVAIANEADNTVGFVPFIMAKSPLPAITETGTPVLTRTTIRNRRRGAISHGSTAETVKEQKEREKKKRESKAAEKTLGSGLTMLQAMVAMTMGPKDKPG